MVDQKIFFITHFFFLYVTLIDYSYIFLVDASLHPLMQSIRDSPQDTHPFVHSNIVNSDRPLILKPTLENPIILAASKKNSLPYTVLLSSSKGVNSKQHYWKCNFTSVMGKAYLGITNKKFELEDKMKGLYYGGDLTNGQDTLIFDYGPMIQTGDIVGMYLKYSQSRFRLSYDINDKYLGLAFDVPINSLEDAIPLIQFHNNGIAACQKQNVYPLDHQFSTCNVFCFSGQWVLHNVCAMNSNNQNIMYNLSKMQQPTLKIDSDDSRLILHAHIKERISIILERKGNAWISTHSIPLILFGKYTSNTLTDQQLETILLPVLQDPNRIYYEGHSLVIRKGPIVSIWYRLHYKPRSFIGSPFQP